MKFDNQMDMTDSIDKKAFRGSVRGIFLGTRCHINIVLYPNVRFEQVKYGYRDPFQVGGRIDRVPAANSDHSGVFRALIDRNTGWTR